VLVDVREDDVAELDEVDLARYGRDAGEMRARCGRDVGEMWARYGGDICGGDICGGDIGESATRSTVLLLSLSKAPKSLRALVGVRVRAKVRVRVRARVRVRVRARVRVRVS
jgi:hypothetical protein